LCGVKFPVGGLQPQGRRLPRQRRRQSHSKRKDDEWQRQHWSC